MHDVPQEAAEPITASSGKGQSPTTFWFYSTKPSKAPQEKSIRSNMAEHLATLQLPSQHHGQPNSKWLAAWFFSNEAWHFPLSVKSGAMEASDFVRGYITNRPLGRTLLDCYLDWTLAMHVPVPSPHLTAQLTASPLWPAQAIQLPTIDNPHVPVVFLQDSRHILTRFDLWNIISACIRKISHKGPQSWGSSGLTLLGPPQGLCWMGHHLYWPHLAGRMSLLRWLLLRLDSHLEVSVWICMLNTGYFQPILEAPVKQHRWYTSWHKPVVRELHFKGN